VTQKEDCTKMIELELGSRSINKQGKHNKTIVIPKVALENCNAGNLDKMNVSIVKTSKGERFIKLTAPDEIKSDNESDDKVQEVEEQ